MRTTSAFYLLQSLCSAATHQGQSGSCPITIRAQRSEVLTVMFGWKNVQICLNGLGSQCMVVMFGLSPRIREMTNWHWIRVLTGRAVQRIFLSSDWILKGAIEQVAHGIQFLPGLQRCGHPYDCNLDINISNNVSLLQSLQSQLMILTSISFTIFMNLYVLGSTSGHIYAFL